MASRTHKTTLNQIAMFNFPTDLKSNSVVPLQTNPLVFSTCRKSDSLFATELAGLVSRARNRHEPSGFYQKSYPGSDGVTEGILITRNKSG